MSAVELAQRLHNDVPLCRAMQVAVDVLDSESIVLSAPLDPNINPHGTAFGGSLATLLTLSAWALLMSRLESAGLGSDLVVYKSDFKYSLPVEGRLRAYCRLPEPSVWDRFERSLRQKKRARILMQAHVPELEKVAVSMTAQFVASVDPQ